MLGDPWYFHSERLRGTQLLSKAHIHLSLGNIRYFAVRSSLVFKGYCLKRAGVLSTDSPGPAPCLKRYLDDCIKLISTHGLIMVPVLC